MWAHHNHLTLLFTERLNLNSHNILLIGLQSSLYIKKKNLGALLYSHNDTNVKKKKKANNDKSVG